MTTTQQTPIGPAKLTGTVSGVALRYNPNPSFGSRNSKYYYVLSFRLQAEGEANVVLVEMVKAIDFPPSGNIADGDLVSVVDGDRKRNGPMRAKTVWNHTLNDSVYTTLRRPSTR